MNKYNIVIVGGGTSGWMAANMLSVELPLATITVIESDAVPTVGVGEGSTPFFKTFFEQIGISEKTWMPACHATYKNGITFPGWAGESSQNHYFHPFYSEVDSEQVPVFFAACAARLKGYNCCAAPDDFFVTGHLAQHHKAPVHRDTSLDYGYHFDAGLLGEFLKKVALEKGVIHVSDTVSDVNVGDDNQIQHLDTQRSGRYQADWFIDCTGFKRLLIQSALQQSFISYRDYLLCDSAVAFAASCDEAASLQSSTLSTAVKEGWIWTIPLSHRTGTGLVYSADYVTEKDAIAALSAFHQMDRPLQYKSLHWHPGYVENSWAGNCVAIGLSQGFLEPLEAPMLNITQQSISLFIEALRQEQPSRCQRAFNQKVQEMFEGTRDYVQAHYLLNQRRDSDFWHVARRELKVSAGLASLLEHWSKGLSIDSCLGAFPHLNFYLKTSWYCLLSGLQYFPQSKSDIPAHSARIIANAQQRAANIALDFFDHKDVITGIGKRGCFEELSFA